MVVVSAELRRARHRGRPAAYGPEWRSSPSIPPVTTAVGSAGADRASRHGGGRRRAPSRCWPRPGRRSPIWPPAAVKGFGTRAWPIPIRASRCCRWTVVGRRRHPAPADSDPAPTGRVIAVWGPTGAPGRSTVATGIAVEAAAAGVPTLLVDADVYGGVLASAFGLLDESPGLAGACRQAANGRLDWRRSPGWPGRCNPTCGCSPASPGPTGGRRCGRRPYRRCSAVCRPWRR